MPVCATDAVFHSKERDGALRRALAQCACQHHQSRIFGRYDSRDGGRYSSKAGGRCCLYVHFGEFSCCQHHDTRTMPDLTLVLFHSTTRGCPNPRVCYPICFVLSMRRIRYMIVHLRVSHCISSSVTRRCVDVNHHVSPFFWPHSIRSHCAGHKDLCSGEIGASTSATPAAGLRAVLLHRFHLDVYDFCDRNP